MDEEQLQQRLWQNQVVFWPEQNFITRTMEQISGVQVLESTEVVIDSANEDILDNTMSGTREESNGAIVSASNGTLDDTINVGHNQSTYVSSIVNPVPSTSNKNMDTSNDGSSLLQSGLGANEKENLFKNNRGTIRGDRVDFSIQKIGFVHQKRFALTDHHFRYILMKLAKGNNETHKSIISFQYQSKSEIW